MKTAAASADSWVEGCAHHIVSFSAALALLLSPECSLEGRTASDFAFL